MYSSMQVGPSFQSITLMTVQNVKKDGNVIYNNLQKFETDPATEGFLAGILASMSDGFNNTAVVTKSKLPALLESLQSVLGNSFRVPKGKLLATTHFDDAFTKMSGSIIPQKSKVGDMHLFIDANFPA